MKMLQGMKATLLLLNNLEHDNEEKTLEDSVAAIALKGRSNTKSRKLYSNRSAQPGGAATLYDAVKCGVFMEKAIMEKDDAEYLDEGGDEEEYVSGQVTRSVEEEENVSTNSESLQKRKKMVKPLVNDSTKSDDDKSEGQNLPEEDQNHPEESGQEQEIVIGDDAGVKEQDFLQESKQGEEMVNNDDDIREEDQNFLQKSEQEQEMVNDGVGKEEANVVQESEQKQKVGDESGETRDEILYRTATNVRRIIMERKKKRVSPKPQLKQPKATMSSVATPIGVFGKEEMVAAGKESGEFLEQEMVNDPKRLAKAPVQRAGVESVIHDWQKGELLGRGTFGSVYAGIADRGFFFAVKEVSLHDERVEGKQCIIQLEQEIALLRQFEHDNIVRYYGTQKDARHLYIFLELVTQGSLLRLYQNYDLKDPQVSGYTRQILHGLKYLHDRNVIHRDIKCANILVHTNGLVKLADFGLAKAAKLNDVKSCKGTAFWMAPEVVRSKGYGLAVDIWSLGCTVLEMLTGSFPFSGLECMAAIYKIGQGERPFVPDTLSRNARDFILQCLQVNPSLRPTAAQLLDHPFVKRPLLKRPLPSSSGVASAHSFGWQF